MMKIKKCIVSCIAIFGIIFAMALPASADNTKYDHNKICIYCLGKDAFSPREGFASLNYIVQSTSSNVSREQRSYWKEITQFTIYDGPGKPSLSSFPQTVYYEEKNPYGSGQAHGTLSIKKFSHIENGSNHYYVTYAGYMYWYD